MSAPAAQGQVNMRVLRGGVRAQDWLEHPRLALADLVDTTGAFDGGIAVCDALDLRVVTSLQARFSRRTVTAHHCPSVAAAIRGQVATWLDGSAAEGLYLPPHTQVLFVPFTGAGGRPCAALLAYHQAVDFSPRDWLALRGAFELPGTPPPAPSGALQLVA